MALTQTDVERLEAMVASGTLEVEYDGKRIKHNSVNDLLRALSYAKAQVAAAAGAPRTMMAATTFTRD